MIAYPSTHPVYGEPKWSRTVGWSGVLVAQTVIYDSRRWVVLLDSEDGTREFVNTDIPRRWGQKGIDESLEWAYLGLRARLGDPDDDTGVVSHGGGKRKGRS